jgi:hypothetical protein
MPVAHFAVAVKFTALKNLGRRRSFIKRASSVPMWTVGTKRRTQ